MSVPSEEVIERYGSWKPPDAKKAAEALRVEHAHHDFFDVWPTRLRDLREFGTGHLLYFHFLRWMALLFLGLFVLVSVPQIALNWEGRYYDAADGSIAATALGNFGRVSVAHHGDGASLVAVTDELFQRERNITLAFLSDAGLPPATSPFNKRAAIVAMSILNTLGAAAFFLATMALAVVSRRLCAQADAATVTIHDYSIRVQRLPRDTDARELVEFFSQYGEVVHVEMVRAYGTLLGLVLRRGKALRAFKGAVARLQRRAAESAVVDGSLVDAVTRASDQLFETKKEMREEQAQSDSRRVVAAFVTFREEAGKVACLAQPQSRMRQWWSLDKKHKLRGIHALAICDAPEPSDVKYENIENGVASRAGRRLFTSALQYLGLAVGFVLISMASAMRFNQAAIAGVDRKSCNASCNYKDAGGLLSLTSPNREVYAACSNGGRLPDGSVCVASEVICYKCYCFEAITAGIINEAPYCFGEAGLMVLSYSAQAVNILGILLINMVLVWSSRWLTLFEKHHTRSQEARSLAQKLFLSQFLNSALSTIIANAHLPGLSKLVVGTKVQNIFFQGIYTDLTPNWYKTVGVSIITSQFIATAVRAATIIASWASARFAARRAAQGHCLTYEELLEAGRGPAFLLDSRYGEHLNTVFVTMLLSAGLPVAYLSAAVWFGAAYWTEKWELLKLSRRPVAYGGDLAESISGILPFATVFHFAFATWAFSFFGTPTSKLLTPGFARLMLAITARLEPLWRDASGLPPALAAQRLLSATGLHLLTALVVVVGVLFLQMTLTAWLRAGRLLLSLVGLIADAQVQELSGAPEFAIALRTQLLVGASTYAVQEQPEYEAAFGRGPDGEEDAEVQLALSGVATAKRATREMAAAAPAGVVRVSPRAPAERQISAAEREREEEEDMARRQAAGAASGSEASRSEGGTPRQQQQQQPVQTQALTAAQRLRRARANQVVPLPEEWRGGPNG